MTKATVTQSVTETKQVSTFTPGPWHTGGVTNPTTLPRLSVWGPTPQGAQSGEWIARDISPANARLIAAAPDLYNAMKDAMEFLDLTLGPCDADCECLLHMFHAALLKAEGGAQ